ncbi:heme A synthase [Psychromonas sp.]|uniref:COX15/CtaA family protein n=1 Tax=Psychromonas sp. TaxID=1884585 RepID=UPI003562F977
MYHKYKILVLLSCLLSVIVVGLGAYTRLSDSGLGCPDWPGCYGFLTVPTHADLQSVTKHNLPDSDMVFEPAKAWKEMIHRYFAGALGLLLLAILFFSLFIKRHFLKQQALHNINASQGIIIPLKLPVLLVILVLFQAVLGMLTVTMQLQPLIVMGHLLGGFAILSLLTLLYLRLRTTPLLTKSSFVAHYFSWCVTALLVLLIQIALGGWLAANYAAPYCAGLPLCSGGWSAGDWQQNFSILDVFQLPAASSNYEFGVLSAQARMSIHLLHRFWAIFTFMVILVVAMRIYWLSRCQKTKNSALLVITLLVCQVLLGVFLVYWTFPISIALAHNLMAAMLLLSLIRLTYYVKLSPLPRNTPTGVPHLTVSSGEN